MALSQVTSAGVAPDEMYTDSALAATEQAVSNAAKELKWITVDNTGNAHVVYFKAYDSDTPTVGTTEPLLCIPVAAGLKPTIPVNHAFPNGLAVACIKHVGAADGPGRSGTTAPTSSVPVIFTTD